MAETSDDYCDGRPFVFGNCAGVILYRHSGNGDIEVALQLRDDYPAWGQLGIGAIDENETALACAIREVREETNYPIDEHCDRLQFLFETHSIYEDSGERMEGIAMWALDVGGFPLEKRGEGVAVAFFPLKEKTLPPNLSSYVRDVLFFSANCLRIVPNRSPLIYRGAYHPFDRLPLSDYVGLELFDKNEKVMARRRNAARSKAGLPPLPQDAKYGFLRWDHPDAAMKI